MEATENNLLKGVFTKTLNLTEEEVSDLLYKKADDSEELVLREDALNLVLDRDTTRVANIKKSVKPDKKDLDAEYARGAYEGMSKFEASAKELYNISSDSQGVDLVKEIINSVSECNVITDENVKSHSAYLELEKNSIPKTKYETLEQDLEDFKLNIDKSQTFSRVKSDVLTIFNGLNPIVSDNQSVAQTRQNDFLGKFEAYDYEIADDGNHLIKQNGSRLEDQHGNPIKFADFVKRVASLNYDFNASDDKGQAGNSNDGAASRTVGAPKDEKDYMSQMAALMVIVDPNERTKKTTELKKAWEESQKN